jgi:hypothetical protein
MAVGFGVADVEGFPTERFQTSQQRAIDGDDAVTTIVEPVRGWSHPEFKKFEVIHESRLYFEGRFRNEPIDSVVRRYRFFVYLDADGKTAFVQATKKLWHEAFRRIEKDQHATLTWKARELDLIALRAKLEPRIGGGWFGDMKIAKVETAGIFGANVASSDEWERYEQLGRLSAIIIDFTFGDDDYKLMLGQDSTIVIYRDLAEAENLAFVKAILSWIAAGN